MTILFSSVNLLINEEITMKKSILVFLKGIVSVAAVLVFVIAISGCQKEEGTMEKAGEKIDKAVEKAGEKVGEGAEAAKEGVEKAGEKVKEGAEKAADATKKAAEKVEDKVKK
jgi:hypothetical protein